MAGLTIDISNYGEFEKRIKLADTAIDRLNKQIVRLGTTFDRIDITKGAVKFGKIGKEITRNLEQGIKAGAPGVEKTALKVSDRIYSAMRAFWQTGSPSKKAWKIGEDIMAGFGEGFKAGYKSKFSAKKLDAMFRELIELMKRLKSVGAAGKLVSAVAFPFKMIGKALQGIGRLLKIIRRNNLDEELSRAKFREMTLGLQRLANFLGEYRKYQEKIGAFSAKGVGGAINIVLKEMVKIEVLMALLKRAVRSVQDIDMAGISKLSLAMKRFGSFLTEYQELFASGKVKKSTFPIKTAMRALEGLEMMMRILGNAIREIKVVNAEGYAKLLGSLTGLSSFLSEYSAKISGKSGIWGQLKNLGKLKIARAIRPIAGQLSGINSLTSIIASALTNLKTVPDKAGVARVLGALTPMLEFIRGYVEFGDKVGRFRSLGKFNFQGFIRPFAGQLRGLKSMAKILASALGEFDKIRNPEAIGKVLVGLKAVMQFINDYATFVEPKQAIGGRIKKLLTLDFAGALRPIAGSLKGIRPVMKILASALKNFKDVPDPEGIASMIRAINMVVGKDGIVQSIQEIRDRTQGTASLSKIGSFISRIRNTELTNVIRGLVPVFKLLGKAVRELGGINFQYNPALIGQLFSASGDFINTMSTTLPKIVGRRFKFFTKIDKDFGALPKVFKIIAKAMNALRKIKVSPGAMTSASEAIGNFANAIQKLSGSKMSLGNLNDDLKNLSPVLEKLGKGMKTLSEVGGDTNKISKMARALVDVANALNKFQGLEALEDITEKLRSELPRIIEEVIRGMEKGKMPEKFHKLGEKSGDALADGAEEALEITSPSRVFIRIGKFAIDGLVMGIKTGFRNVYNVIKQLVTGIGQRMITGMRQIGQSVRRAGFSAFRGGKTMLVSGGIIGLITGAGTNLAADFDRTINQIRIFGNIAGEELQRVRNEILKFSAETIFDPKQSSEAFLNLQKAGLDAAEALRILPEVGKLAAAGDIQLEEATNAVVRGLQTFNLEIDESTRVVDAYARAANLSTADVKDLIQGMGNVGPIAANFGLSFEQTVAVLSKFSDAGVTSAEAGTQLKSMLTNLTRPTKRTQDTFKSLGVTMADANGNIKDVNQLINELSVATGKLTQEKRLQAIQKLAGTFGQIGLSVLLAGGEDGINGFVEEMNKLPDAAKISAEMMDDFKGVIESFKGSVQTLTIKALTPLMNKVFRPMLKIGIKLVNWFASLPEPVLLITSGIVAFSAALITLTGVGLVLIAVVLIPLGTAFLAMSVAMSAALFVLTNPVGLLFGIASFGIGLLAIAAVVITVTAALAAMAAAFASLYDSIKNNKEVRTAFDGMISAIQTLFSLIGELFTAWMDLINGMSAFNRVTSENAGNLSGLANIFDTVKNKVMGLVSGIRDLIMFLGILSDVNVESKREHKTRVSALEAERQAVQDQIDAIEHANRMARRTGETDLIDTGILIPQEHIVKSGESLQQLADRWGTTVDEIQRLNELTGGIHPEDILLIPGIETAGSELAEAQKQLEKLDNQIRTSEQRRKKLFRDEGIDYVSEQEGRLSALQTRIDKFAKTKLGKTLFTSILGDDPARVSTFIKKIMVIEIILARMGGQMIKIKEAFGQIFTGDISGGVKNLGLSLARLLGNFTDLLEETLSIDIDDAFQNVLKEGTLKEISNFLLRKGKTLGKAIIRAVTPIFASLFGELVKISTKFFFGWVGKLFPELKDDIDKIAEFMGEMTRSALQNIGDVIAGDKTAKDAFADFAGDIGLDIGPDSPAGRAFAFLVDIFGQLKESWSEAMAVFSGPESEGLKRLVDVLAGAAAVSAFIAVATVVGLLTGALKALEPFLYVLSGLGDILGGIVAGDVSLIATGIRKIAGGLLAMIPAFMSGVGDALASLLSAVGLEGLAEKVQGVADAFGNVADDIMNMITDDEALGQFLVDASVFFGGLFDGIARVIVDGAKKIPGILFALIPDQGQDILISIFHRLFGTGGQDAKQARATFMGLGVEQQRKSKLGTLIEDIFNGFVQGVKDTVRLFVEGIPGMFSRLDVGYATDALWNAATGLMKSLFGGGGEDAKEIDLATPLVALIGEEDLATPLAALAGEAADKSISKQKGDSALVKALKSFVDNELRAVGDFLWSIPGTLFQLGKDAGKVIANAGADLFNSLFDKIFGGDERKPIVEIMGGDDRDKLKKENPIVKRLRDIVDGIGPALKILFGGISFTGIKDTVSDAFSGLFDFLSFLPSDEDIIGTLGVLWGAIISALPDASVREALEAGLGVIKSIAGFVGGLFGIGGDDEKDTGAIAKEIESKLGELGDLEIKLGLSEESEEGMRGLGKTIVDLIRAGVISEEAALGIDATMIALATGVEASVRAAFAIAEGEEESTTMNDIGKAVIAGIDNGMITAKNDLEKTVTAIAVDLMGNLVLSLALSGVAISLTISSVSAIFVAKSKKMRDEAILLVSVFWLLTVTIHKLVGALRLLGNTEVSFGGGGGGNSGGGGPPPGMASGGRVAPGTIYEINEERKGVPFEVFNVDGTSYLISSRGGQLQSPVGAPSVGGSGGGAMDIEVNYNIEINGSGLSEGELQSAVRNGIAEERQNNPARIKLKNAGFPL